MGYIFITMSLIFFFQLFLEDDGYKELYLCGMIVTGIMAIMAQVIVPQLLP